MMTRTVWRRLGRHRGVMVAVHVPDPSRRPPTPKIPKPLRPTLDQIFFKVETMVGEYFPDGDPADFIVPWMKRTGIKWPQIDAAVRKHTKRRTFYEWLASMWDDCAADTTCGMQEAILSGKRVEQHGMFHYVKDGVVVLRPNPWR